MVNRVVDWVVYSMMMVYNTMMVNRVVYGMMNLGKGSGGHQHKNQREH